MALGGWPLRTTGWDEGLGDGDWGGVGDGVVGESGIDGVVVVMVVESFDALPLILLMELTLLAARLVEDEMVESGRGVGMRLSVWLILF